MPQTVILARHCDVENPRRLMYGHLPGFGLSELGRSQAHGMGAHLAELDVATLRASPLQRAQETASIICQHIPGLKVETDPDLVEAEFGKYLQGVPYSQVPLRRPRWFIHYAFPGLLADDEGVKRMAERVGRALDRARSEAGDRVAVCICHADPVQAFWVNWLGLDGRQLHRYPVAKGGFLELTYEGDAITQVVRHQPRVGHEPPSGSPAQEG